MKKTKRTEKPNISVKNATVNIPAENLVNSDMSSLLREAEENVLKEFQEAIDAVAALSHLRLRCKLSNARVAGVYRELKELMKVLSVYK